MIDRFLAGRRLAVVGVSRNPQEFSRMLFAELAKKGYDVVPVRPGDGEIDGRRVFARVQDIPEPVDGVLVMTPPKVAEQIVRDCAEAGVKRVWLHRGAGQGAVSKEAVAFCEENGIEVVPGECPFMFMGGSIHDWHRAVREMTGHFPLGDHEQVAADRKTKGMLAALIAIELFVAIGAFYGGGSMVMDPAGTPGGLPLPADLPGLRFGSYLVPGVLLILANGLWPLAVVIGSLAGRRWAVTGHMIAGMVLTGWTAVEVLMLGWISFLQPVMLLLGAVLFLLGSVYRSRKEGDSKKHLAVAT